MKYNAEFESKWPKRDYPTDESAQNEALKTDEALQAFKAYRERVKDDAYMPLYHFYAPDGYINDPNGLCKWNGQYHLFYQAYPPVDPRQHWGHAVSDDMVHWKDLPTAIYPNPEKCVFSGSSYVEENRVIAIYHGLTIGNMIATSSDPMLLNWEKLEANPVIPHLEGADDGRPYRVFDPFIWKEEEGYYALSGTYYGPNWMGGKGTREKSRMVHHLFFSQDLDRWAYIGELFDENVFIPEGNDGACPYFWPIGDKHMLLWFSHSTGPHCLLGTYDKIRHKFHPEKHVQLSFGPVGNGSLHAPCATPDGEGGLFVIYNTTDSTNALERWGAMSLMRHMRLENDEIIIEPVEQITSLRKEKIIDEKLHLKANEEHVFERGGKLLDIEAEIDLKDAATLCLRVLRSPDRKEETSINLYRNDMRFHDRFFLRDVYLSIDTTLSSTFAGLNGRNPEITKLPSQLDDQHPIKLRVLVDKCIIEVFANGRALFQMAYPALEDSQGISIEARGGDASVQISAWTQNGIYE